MAHTSAEQAGASGWKFIVVPEDDFSGFTDEMLEGLRKGAMERMGRAQDLVVKEVRHTISKVYPLIRAGGSRQRRTADPMVRAIRSALRPRDIRQPAPAGQPPGYIMGDLWRSWRKGRRWWNKNKTVLTGVVFSDHVAAGVLEWGALKSSNIRPHPYYRPTIARITDQLARILEGRDEAAAGTGAGTGAAA